MDQVPNPSNIYLFTGYIIGPLLVNFGCLVFIVCAYATAEAITTIRNSIAIFAIFFYYLHGFIVFLVFGLVTDIWNYFKEQVRGGIVLIILISVFYPVYFLVTLPMTIFYLFRLIGTPWRVWERMFSNTCMSFSRFNRADSGGCCGLFLKYLGVGFLFVLFFIIYVALFILFIPVELILLSPVGFGPYGVVLYTSLRHLHSFQMFQWERIEESHKWCIFTFVYFVTAPWIAISISFVVVALLSWYGVMLAVIAVLYFVIFFFPAARNMCCNRWANQYV